MILLIVRQLVNWISRDRWLLDRWIYFFDIIAIFLKVKLLLNSFFDDSSFVKYREYFYSRNVGFRIVIWKNILILLEFKKILLLWYWVEWMINITYEIMNLYRQIKINMQGNLKLIFHYMKIKKRRIVIHHFNQFFVTPSKNFFSMNCDKWPAFQCQDRNDEEKQNLFGSNFIKT